LPVTMGRDNAALSERVKTLTLDAESATKNPLTLGRWAFVKT